MSIYVASGMKYYFVHTYNHASFIENTVNADGVGAVIEAGFITKIFQCLLLDFFVSYSYKSFGAPYIPLSSVQATAFDVSSLNLGIGLGFQY